MIDRDEVRAKAAEFGITPANVERDYIFGWLLAGVYEGSALGPQLVLKGGNCFRKGYFPRTRFSNDLDFSAAGAIEPGLLVEQLNEVCRQVQAATGVEFVTDRTRAEEKAGVDRERRLFQARVYFRDFYGKPEAFTISVRLDVAAFDRLYLPVQQRRLIHPYSDAAACMVELRCTKLEELLAIKLKCLLQRRHLADLFDLVYGVFFNRDLAVDRAEVLRTFLQRTIFEPSPGMAKTLLLELPLEAFRAVWRRYIICPVQSLFEFDVAIDGFRKVIESIFGPVLPDWYAEEAFFPSRLRNPIMEAAAGQTVLELDYHGVRRRVEPYSLAFKQRRDGFAREYFYAYDQTGGQTSGPGLKAFVHTDIESLRVTEEQFVPRYPIELSKAGEVGERDYFTSRFGGTRGRGGSRRIYLVECSYCGRRFERLKLGTRLRNHKDAFGNACYGRSGRVVDRGFG